MIRCGGGRADRGCGKPILWGMQPNGARVPLDPRAPVYEITGVRADGTLNVRAFPAIDLAKMISTPATEVVRARLAMVGHFVACPRSNQSPRPPAKKKDA